MAQDGGRRRLAMDLDPAVAPEIAHWLWALADGRRRTMETLEGLDEANLDIPGPGGNSIGTVLAHIALIEVDWLFVEILEQPYPDDLTALLPPTHRNPDGTLMATPGTSLAAYMRALEAARERLEETLRGMDIAEFHRPRALPGYDVTPAWVAHHLVQHEAEHRSEIGVTRAMIEGRRTH